MAILSVKQDGSGDYTTIQAAIVAANTGDIVDIAAGIYNENVDLYKGVILQGAGQSQTEIKGFYEAAFTKAGCTFSLASTVLNFSGGTAGLKAGRLITGTGIPANARIVSVSTNSVTINANTTAAKTTAIIVTMPGMDATVRVRGANSVIKNLKVVGYDGPSAATEHAAIYYRNTGAGSAAATDFILENCEVVADGEYALLTDSIASVKNGIIRNNKFSGKTFTGTNPSSGSQFTVLNVPRQLVTIQGVNVNMQFTGNLVEGVTGGLTLAGTPSFNSAVTVDPVSAVVKNNVIRGVFGYGSGLRARGASADVQNNVVYAYGSYNAANFVITGTGAINLNNSYLTQGLVEPTQSMAGQPITIKTSSVLIKAMPQIAQSANFSNEAEWKMVSYIYKHDSSSKRFCAGFSNLAEIKPIKLRAGMMSGQKYQLVKMIVSKLDRSLLVIKRSEIQDAESYDFVLG